MIHKVLADGIGCISLIEAMGNDMSIVNAARISFKGESKGEEMDKKLLFYLMRNKHSSPFEMVEFKFYVKCPIFVARQWMRHRTFSYNEISRRYTQRDIEFWRPSAEILREQSESNKQSSVNVLPLSLALEAVDIINELYESTEYAYNALLNLGVCREQARIVLPVGLYTEFFVKGNLRNWLHFIELRSHDHAQVEIQLYSNKIKEIISEYVPWTIEAFDKYVLNV